MVRAAAFLSTHAAQFTIVKCKVQGYQHRLLESFDSVVMYARISRHRRLEVTKVSMAPR